MYNRLSLSLRYTSICSQITFKITEHWALNKIMIFIDFHMLFDLTRFINKLLFSILLLLPLILSLIQCRLSTQGFFIHIELLYYCIHLLCSALDPFWVGFKTCFSCHHRHFGVFLSHVIKCFSLFSRWYHYALLNGILLCLFIPLKWPLPDCGWLTSMEPARTLTRL